MTSNAPKQGACLLTTRIFTKMRKKTRTRDRGMLLALLSNYTCLSWPATATLTVSPSLLAGVHMRAKSSDGLRRCLWNNRRNFVYLETAPECGRGPPGVLPWLTFPGHGPHTLAAPNSRWTALPSPIACAVKEFTHRFPPWRLAGLSLLTRTLTSFRIYLGIILSLKALIHPPTASPEGMRASPAGPALGRPREPPPSD